MRRGALLAAAPIAAALLAGHAPAPAAGDAPLAIVHAHILTMGGGGEIAAGTIVLRGTRIAAVGADVAVPSDARTIDAHGAVVTPGLVMTGGVLGIVDLPGYGSLDDSATDSRIISAAYPVAPAVNPANPDIAEARADGVVYALSLPRVGEGSAEVPRLFGGRGVVIDTAAGGGTIVSPDAGIVALAGGAGAGKVGGGRGTTIVLLQAALALARHRGGDSPVVRERQRALRLSDMDLAALRPVIDRRHPLFVRADRASDLLALLGLAARERIDLILVGAREGWLVADRIAAAKVPVILDPEASVPRGLEDVGTRPDNAARLAAKGVRISFVAVHARPDHLVRSPRLSVGRLVVRTGLPYRTALAALSIDAARTAGIADRTGSIEAGKRADIVIWHGDPLGDVDGPAHVFAGGVDQSLDTRSAMLGRRYLARLRAEGVLPPAATAP